jgi:hypothetical protein
VNGFARNRIDGEQFSDHRRRQWAESQRRLALRGEIID